MFRLYMSVGCFAPLACLLITPSAFAQIDVPDARQATVQQLRHKIDELREENRGLKSERALPCRSNLTRERSQFKFPTEQFRIRLFESHLKRLQRLLRLRNPPQSIEHLRKPPSAPDPRGGARNVPPQQFL